MLAGIDEKREIDFSLFLFDHANTAAYLKKKL